MKKLWNDYGIGAIIILIILAYGVGVLANYLTNKGRYGKENMDQSRNPLYNNDFNNTASQNHSRLRELPANSPGQQGAFVDKYLVDNGAPGIPTSCTHPNIQNPSELLPKDTNSQWAILNPTGKGELANVNLLRAGYHIGIDSIGASLRNANQQIRSDPPNPQLYTGPWNLSTIEPDFMRPPLEIGAGAQ
jgi:hypothetical protein